MTTNLHAKKGEKHRRKKVEKGDDNSGTIDDSVMEETYCQPVYDGGRPLGICSYLGKEVREDECLHRAAC